MDLLSQPQPQLLPASAEGAAPDVTNMPDSDPPDPSALQPPADLTRRSTRRPPGGPSGFKRGGWAALDEEDGGMGWPKRKRASQTRSPASVLPKVVDAERSSAAPELQGSSAAARKRNRELFPHDAAGAEARLHARADEESVVSTGASEIAEADADVDGEADADGDADGGDADADADSAADKPQGAEQPTPKKKRNRGKRLDEGDWKELKPRHLRGKKKDELVARQQLNAAAAAARRSNPPPQASDVSEEVKAQLTRLLRPKLRRWCMYEWFYSPVDWGWFRENEFTKMLQDCGLGRVTHLTRCEWSFVRMMLGRARRFSSAFLEHERAKLRSYREGVRGVRRLQAAGNQSWSLEADLGLHGSAQMAVGQRVTAFHPKERHLFTGTVLTPDGDHYKVQFDRTKQGVQLVKDVLVMPLLDGSRGIDFTSPRSLGPTEGAAELPSHADRVGRRLMGSPASAVRADAREVQLVAYIGRLLDRKQLLMSELKKVCTEAESVLMQKGIELHAGLSERGADVPGLLVPEDTPPPRVEVTAAQQRQLGQVPPPPVLPSLQLLLQHSRAVMPTVAQQLNSMVPRWRQEIRWLQDELRGTTKALDNALAAMRPLAQRLSIALGASAPEPQSRGLGLAQCAELKEHATDRSAAIVSKVLTECSDGTAPSEQLRDVMSASISLLMQIQAWASAPISPAECKFAVVSALQKLKPPHVQNQGKFQEIVSATHLLQSIMSGVPVPSASTGMLPRRGD